MQENNQDSVQQPAENFYNISSWRIKLGNGVRVFVQDNARIWVEQSQHGRRNVYTDAVRNGQLLAWEFHAPEQGKGYTGRALLNGDVYRNRAALLRALKA